MFKPWNNFLGFTVYAITIKILMNFKIFKFNRNFRIKMNLILLFLILIPCDKLI
jgi:hypothetical protein